MKSCISILLLLGSIAVESSLAATGATSTSVPPDITIAPGVTGECQAQFDCLHFLSRAQQQGVEITQGASYCSSFLAGATPPFAQTLVNAPL